MQTWAILAAKHAALTSGISFGAFRAPGWNSLAGAAIGLLLAGMGLAAAAARRVPSCAIVPAGGQVAAAHGMPPGRWGTRFRRRVDGVLTGMLSEDEGKLSAAARGRTTIEEAEAAEKGFEAPSTWHGDYVDALPWRRPKPPDPYPAVLPRPPDPNLAVRASAGRSSGISGLPEISVAPWPRLSTGQGAGAFSDSPWFTVSATFDGEQLWPLGNRRPGQAFNRADSDDRVLAARGLDEYQRLPSPEPGHRDDFRWFAASTVVESDSVREMNAESSAERDATRWSAGPGPRADESMNGPASAADVAAGYRSRHRVDGPAKDAKPQDGRRSKARHAAPAPSVSAALARKLGGTRPTSRSASAG